MTFILLILACAALFVLNLFVGAVDIPAAEVIDALLGSGAADTPAAFIVTGSRLPMAVTAMLGGGALAASGLMLQTAFRNPLAGPSILGINSGASVGVALVMLLFGGTVSAGSLSVGGEGAVVAGAFAGSLGIMALLLFLSSMLRNSLMLLITGIMIGYLASSVIMLLNFTSSADGIQSYVMWGMSSFGNITSARLPMFALLTLGGIALSLTLVKPLDLLLLGDAYARNLGVNLRRTRNWLLLTTGVLTAAVTAYCGPVSFIGLSVPHIARLMLHTDTHRRLLPATILTGSAVCLLCNLLCVLPFNTVLPLNAVTPLIGAPVVIWVLVRKRK